MELELAFKLQEGRISYQTQVEIPVTIADFYFPTEGRPLLVFVDGRVHLGTAQAVKDEELRLLLRKRGYRVLELPYLTYSEKKRDEFYAEIIENLRRGCPASCRDESRVESL
jgi:very-short-patch-repair endonuclease